MESLGERLQAKLRAIENNHAELARLENSRDPAAVARRQALLAENAATSAACMRDFQRWIRRLAG